MSASVVTVVQARSGSTRLPGKVLRPVAGRPLIALQLDRMARAATSGTIVVAIPHGGEDDELASVVSRSGHAVHRGDPLDLLDRHVGAGRAFGADVVVKVPSDCPLIDPDVIDRVIGAHLADPGRFDYVSNLHPMTWPDGQDVEVMPMEVLETAAAEATAPFEREHTTPFIWERPDRFRLANVAWDRDVSRQHRLTVDYQEDLDLVVAVVTGLGPHAGIGEIVDHLDRSPGVAALNAPYRGVNWYRHHLDELRTVGADETALAPGETHDP